MTRALLVIAAGLVLVPPPVRADATAGDVVLLDTASWRWSPSVVDLVRIQRASAPRASQVRDPAPHADGDPELRAAALLEGDGVAVVVVGERGAGAGSLRLRAFGLGGLSARRAEASAELTIGEGVVFDRAVALKVSHLIDGVVGAGVEPPDEPAVDRLAAVAGVEAAVLGPTGNGGPQLAVGLSFGAAWRRPGLDASLSLVLSRPTALERLDGDRRVRVTELDAAVAAVVLLPLAESFAVGPSARVTLRRLVAAGRSPRRMPGGEAVEIRAELAAGVRGELALGAGLVATAEAGIAWSPLRDELTVEGRPVLDLGRLRGALAAGLALEL